MPVERRRRSTLALARQEDFTAISKVLTKWQEEEPDLADRIDRRNSGLEPLPEALDAIAPFADFGKKLKVADRVKLAHAAKHTAVSIIIGTRMATNGGIEHREQFGELRLHEALHKKRIPIPDEAIGQRKVWRVVGYQSPGNLRRAIRSSRRKFSMRSPAV
jgi:hypothetical protein